MIPNHATQIRGGDQVAVTSIDPASSRFESPLSVVRGDVVVVHYHTSFTSHTARMLTKLAPGPNGGEGWPAEESEDGGGSVGYL